MSYYWEHPPRNIYYISGILHDDSGLVSHYAVHEFLDPGVTGCRQFTKEELIALIETEGVKVFVWGWDYKTGRFQVGKQVYCSTGKIGKFLHHMPYEQRTKNLKHLIKISWFKTILSK